MSDFPSKSARFVVQFSHHSLTHNPIPVVSSILNSCCIAPRCVLRVLLTPLLWGLVLFLLTGKPAYAIVGGVEATPGDQRWTVGVALAKEPNGYYAQFCGASLIAADWVLTAAHCTYDDDGYPFAPEDLDVLIGRHALDKSTGERIRVARIIRHPAFVAETFDADLALLHLSESSQGETIQIGTRSERNLADVATVFGWGISDDGSPVNNLRQVSMPLVSQQDCRSVYTSYGRVISANMLCAGFAQGGKDACNGDSGGPLAIQNPQSGEWRQLGIVSWGEGCGYANLYGVYTNLGAYRLWIHFQMRYARH